jgi:hypothetical protein
MAFLRAGRLLESLREIHRTRSGWFSGEASRGLILATLMTAEIYSRLKLHAAAKYYALAAAALVPENHLDLYPQCLFRAAEADYHQGAWFSATQLYQKAFTAHGLMAERPFDLDRVLHEYEDFYNTHRPHRTLNQAAPLHPLPDGITDLDHFRIRRRDRAGGIIHEYRLVA